MKILYLADARSTHFHRWFLKYAAMGHDVHVASARPMSWPGVTTHALPSGGPFIPRLVVSAACLHRILKRVQPDVVHAHHVIEYGFIAALAGARPLVCTAMGSDVLIGMDSRKRRWLARYACRRAGHVIVRGEHMREAVRRLGARRITVIPNGIDLGRYPAPADVVIGRGRTILCARNFKPVYNIPTLVEALGLLHARGVPFQATITGDGEGRAEIERRLDTLGIRDRVALPGAIAPDAMPALYAAHRIYVSPSLSDGSSVAMMEAMASGCLPVVSDIPANRAWINNGDNGYLFAPTDAGQLCDRLAMALDGPDGGKYALGRNRQLVEQRADFEKCVGQVSAVYQDAIAAMPRG